MVYAKHGATAAQVTTEIAACKGPVKEISSYEYLQAPAGDYSLEGAAGAAIATLIVGAVRTASARDRGMIICMRKKGFAYLPLTPDEDAAYTKQAEGAARDAWLDAFLAAIPEARVSEALRPVHPPLPAGDHAPFMVGPVRLHSDSLKLGEGTLGYGSALVTARATRRATASVRAAADVGVLPPTILRARGTAQTGAVFHQINYSGPPGAAEEDRTMWCGPVEMPKGRKLICVTSHFTGQRIAMATGPAFFAAPDPDYSQVRLDIRTPLDLELLPPETSPVFDVELKAGWVTKRDISLWAVLTYEGKAVDVWSGARDFDADGRAILPFWDRDLVMTRDGKGVTVAFRPRTDGLGWYDKLPKPKGAEKAD